MSVELVKPKCLVLVLCLRFAEVYAYNVEYPVSDSNSAEIIGNSDKVNYDIQHTTQVDIITDQTSLDTWSVIWYIASFGGLVLFFLIVSCSEWCCRRNARRNCQRNSNTPAVQVVVDTPPPSYDHFAPPSYEDLWVGNSERTREEKNEYDIYVVPVHALGTLLEQQSAEEAPPSYQSASADFKNSDLPQTHRYPANPVPTVT